MLKASDFSFFIWMNGDYRGPPEWSLDGNAAVALHYLTIRVHLYFPSF